MECDKKTVLLTTTLVLFLFSSQSMLVCAGTFKDDERVPAEDAYVDQDNPTSNYGSEDRLTVKAGSGTANKRSFLQFNVARVTSSCTLINATLKLYCYSVGGGPTYKVYRTDDSFTEASITWNARPGSTGDYVNKSRPASTGWWEVNVTSLFDATESYLGFGVMDWRESSPDGSSDFRSKEYSDSDYHPVLEVCFEYEYMYTFDGEYFEDGSDAGDVCTDVHYENFSQASFYVEGVTEAYFGEQPLFFSWSVNSYLRVYYPPSNGTIKVFTAQAPFYVYSFTLRDYPGIVDDSACFESRRVINNTLYLIERRNVRDNVGNTVPLIMEQGASYLLVLNTSTVEYRFGYFLAGSILEKDLPLPYIDFPSNIKMGYMVRVDASRSADNTEITVNYEDTLEATDNVTLYITYRNNSIAYSDTSTANSVQFQWSSADNETDYITYVMADHGELGSLSWKKLLGWLADFESPWEGLGYLGSWPIDPRYVVSVFIIVVIAGAFSTLTVTVGLFSAVVTAGILIRIGWLSLTGTQQADYLLLSIIGGYIVLNGIADARRRNR